MNNFNNLQITSVHPGWFAIMLRPNAGPTERHWEKQPLIGLVLHCENPNEADYISGLISWYDEFLPAIDCDRFLQYAHELDLDSPQYVEALEQEAVRAIAGMQNKTPSP